jgi:hypothetical protein
MVVTDEGSIELERQGVVWGEIMYEIINSEDIHEQIRPLTRRSRAG